jgi:8-oxo-dGTP diphosphatase
MSGVSHAELRQVYADSGWKPTEEAVLCFIVQDERILLIEKKRGLGAGKINGPGGRLEKEETTLEAALRETEEEVGLIPQEMTKAGILRFQFTDGYALSCTVYRADSYTGEMMETPEARPFWQKISAIPYDQMWADDIHWMNFLLNRTRFEGCFIFAGDQMLFHHVETDSRKMSACFHQ